MGDEAVPDDPHRPTDVRAELAEVRKELGHLRRWAWGNGDLGASERIRRLEEAMGDMTKAVTARLQSLERKADERDRRDEAMLNQWRGGRRALTMLAWLFGLLGTGLSFLNFQTARDVSKVVEVVGELSRLVGP